MNLLVISTAPYTLGGISVVLKTIHTNKVFENHKVTFHFTPPCDMKMVQDLKNEGYEVIIGHNRLHHPLKFIRSLKKLIKSRNYDIVHVHGNSHTMSLELLAAKLAGCPIRIAHAHSTKCNSLFLHKFLSPIFNKLCTHRFACGIEAGKFMYGKKNYTVINNGMELAKFQFNETNRTATKTDYDLKNKIVIGNVANFVEVKNHNFMIDVFAELCKNNENYVLMLLGKGSLMNGIKEKVHALGLDKKVLFIGSTPNVHKYLSAMDIFILPSLYEGVPLTLIEAQSNGLKCIASTNVPEEVNITKNVEFLPIDAGTSVWVERLKNIDLTGDREYASNEAIKKITAAGYDINTQAEKVVNYYRKATEK
ncbi:MAG: glycosyltransferase family 1 protein [Clostridia bacterium]|nr:glycosyltransferase family 1 protein [Clostridia bacterium]